MPVENSLEPEHNAHPSTGSMFGFGFEAFS